MKVIRQLTGLPKLAEKAGLERVVIVLFWCLVIVYPCLRWSLHKVLCACENAIDVRMRVPLMSIWEVRGRTWVTSYKVTGVVVDFVQPVVIRRTVFLCQETTRCARML